MKILNRRETLRLLGIAGGTALWRQAAAPPADAATFACVTTPAETEGPYFVEEMLNRSDIRTDPATGAVSPGLPLTLAITVHQVTDAACGLLAGAHVEIWHCDAGGIYSDETANNSRGKKFLRGYQISDDNGVVNFTTIYPGWYQGRAVHIHFKVRTYDGSQLYDEFTSQFYVDDSITDLVHAQSPYNTRGSRDTRNATDGIFRGTSNNDRLMLNLSKTAEGYAATIDVGVNLKTTAVSRPVISANGVVNAASFKPGVAPGAWITIFGQNLAASSRVLALSDLVSGNLPLSLSGVSVKINNQAAFMQYVSPTQINVQAPADDSLGSVQVTVMNATGASDPAAATLQAILPAFFASQNYVAAVRPDGTIVTGVASSASGTAPAARPGEVLSLYGNGFGPTNPSVAPGTMVQTAAPLTNAVTITIGGAPAEVSFAGLSAAGLYQFNITVPNLPDGDHEVLAQIAGLTTPAGVLLKIKN